MPSGQPVTVKVTFKDDCRRLASINQDIRLQALVQKVATVFKFENEKFVLKYCDEDGDFVTLTNEEELQELFTTTNNKGEKVVRLTLVKEEAEKPPAKLTKTVSFADDIVHSPKPRRASDPSPVDNRDAEYTQRQLAVGRQLVGSEISDIDILQILRDISFYICAREGLSEVKTREGEKKLLKPGEVFNFPGSPREPEQKETGELKAPATPVAPNVETVLMWSVAQVREWIEANGFAEFAGLFEENDINGELLLQLDHDTLKSMGIVSAGKRMQLLRAVALAARLSSRATSPVPTGSPMSPSSPTKKLSGLKV
eukprot:Colp12_sorted_trinity150504_noHs@18042